MINVKLLIAPTVSLSRHNPIWGLHNHCLCIITYKRNSLFSILNGNIFAHYLLCIMYMDRMSKGTLCMSFGKKKNLQITIPDNFIGCLFTNIMSEDSFLFLLGAGTMGRIHSLSWNDRKETNLSTQLMTRAELCCIRKEKCTKRLL